MIGSFNHFLNEKAATPQDSTAKPGSTATAQPQSAGANNDQAAKTELLTVLKNHIGNMEKDAQWKALDCAQAIYNDCAHFMNKTDVFKDQTKFGTPISPAAAMAPEPGKA